MSGNSGPSSRHPWVFFPDQLGLDFPGCKAKRRAETASPRYRAAGSRSLSGRKSEQARARTSHEHHTACKTGGTQPRRMGGEKKDRAKSGQKIRHSASSTSHHSQEDLYLDESTTLLQLVRREEMERARRDFFLRTAGKAPHPPGSRQSRENSRGQGRKPTPRVRKIVANAQERMMEAYGRTVAAEASLRKEVLALRGVEATKLRQTLSARLEAHLAKARALAFATATFLQPKKLTETDDTAKKDENGGTFSSQPIHNEVVDDADEQGTEEGPLDLLRLVVKTQIECDRLSLEREQLRLRRAKLEALATGKVARTKSLAARRLRERKLGLIQEQCIGLQLRVQETRVAIENVRKEKRDALEKLHHHQAQEESLQELWSKLTRAHARTGRSGSTTASAKAVSKDEFEGYDMQSRPSDHCSMDTRGGSSGRTNSCEKSLPPKVLAWSPMPGARMPSDLSFLGSDTESEESDMESEKRPKISLRWTQGQVDVEFLRRVLGAARVHSAAAKAILQTIACGICNQSESSEMYFFRNCLHGCCASCLGAATMSLAKNRDVVCPICGVATVTTRDSNIGMIRQRLEVYSVAKLQSSQGVLAEKIDRLLEEKRAKLSSTEVEVHENQ